MNAEQRDEIRVAIQNGFLSVSWTHGLITQLLRASKRNSVVVNSNPIQANFP